MRRNLGRRGLMGLLQLLAGCSRFCPMWRLPGTDSRSRAGTAGNQDAGQEA